VLAGCGPSKPAYCAARADLQNLLTGVSSLSPTSPTSTLRAEFTKITTAANTVVTEAKGAFPAQTSAIKSSVDTLTTAVDALGTNPTASQIAAVATSALTVVSSVKSFVDASRSKCS
jgi:hypothetical protein